MPLGALAVVSDRLCHFELIAPERVPADPPLCAPPNFTGPLCLSLAWCFWALKGILVAVSVMLALVQQEVKPAGVRDRTQARPRCIPASLRRAIPTMRAGPGLLLLRARRRRFLPNGPRRFSGRIARRGEPSTSPRGGAHGSA